MVVVIVKNKFVFFFCFLDVFVGFFIFSWFCLRFFFFALFYFNFGVGVFVFVCCFVLGRLEDFRFYVRYLRLGSQCFREMRIVFVIEVQFCSIYSRFLRCIWDIFFIFISMLVQDLVKQRFFQGKMFFGRSQRRGV